MSAPKPTQQEINDLIAKCRQQTRWHNAAMKRADKALAEADKLLAKNQKTKAKS